MLNAGTFRAAAAHGEGHRRQRRPTRWPSRWTTRRTSAAARPWSRRTIRISRPSTRSRASIGGTRSSSDLSFELPFGPNKHWLHNGGRTAAVLGGWRGSANFTWQSGTPFTPRVTNAATDVSRGTNGTLRAELQRRRRSRWRTRRSPTSSTPAAFSIPLAGTFGNAPRNLIIGPGSRLLNAQISRDVRMNGNRAVTIQVTASNILNIVNYAAIDTLVQLADLRPGPVGPADALGATQFPVPVLMNAPAAPSRSSSAALHARPVAALGRRRRRRRQPRPVFRANTQLVSVDVIVRDGSRRGRARPDGRRLRGPEDGKPQEIRSFTFEEISEQPAGDRTGGAARGRAGADDADSRAKTPAPTAAAPPRPRRPPSRGAPKPMTSEALAGRRLIVLLFDIASMQPEDVQRAVDSAAKYVDKNDDARPTWSRSRRSASKLDVLVGLQRRQDQGVGGARPARLHGRHGDPAADRRHRRDRRADGRRRHQLGRHDRDGHVQQRRPPARAEGARRDARADRAEEGDPLLQRRHAAERRRQPGRAALGDQRRRPRPRRRSIRSTPAASRRSSPAATRRGRAAAARRSSPAAACAAVLAAVGVAGHARRRSPPTPAAAPSWTRTTSRRRSSACSATCRRTT